MDLKTWAKLHGFTLKKMAIEMDIPYITFQYIYKKKHAPSLVNAIKIKKLTGGKVSFRDLLCPEEKANVRKIITITKGIHHEKNSNNLFSPDSDTRILSKKSRTTTIRPSSKASKNLT
jgi:hypothetical protein